MGMSYTTYVGPFARCRYHMVDSSEKQWQCTKDGKHGRWISREEKFCRVCGSPMADVAVPTKIASVDHWEVFSKAGLDEDPMAEMHGEGAELGAKLLEHWYCANHNRKPPREFSIDGRDKCGLYAADIDMAAEMEWLKTAFGMEISALMAAYDNVEITWGIIHYAL
jgi:hypothetical protein